MRTVAWRPGSEGGLDPGAASRCIAELRESEVVF